LDSEEEVFEIDIIEFDVAITAGSTKQGTAGVGVSVLAVKIGTDGKIGSEHTEVSRVRFSLGVAWPYASITGAKKLHRAK
jgi:hypothetical protein